MLRNFLISAFVGWSLTTTIASAVKDNESSTKASSEIIGSSVVTSVSVILEGSKPDDQTTEALHPNTHIHVHVEQPEFHTNFVRSLHRNEQLPPGHLIVRNKEVRKDEGQQKVQSVIDTLKNIVKEEKEKHENTSQPSTTNAASAQPVDETPPTTTTQESKFIPGTSLSGEDDDEMEATGTNDPGPPTTDAIDDFAKHVVSMSPDEQESENDTATSAEVHDAIHKISGAILSVEGGDVKKKKPIENIVNDVLTSINSARNGSNPEPQPEVPASAVPGNSKVTPNMSHKKAPSSNSKIGDTSSMSNKPKPTTTTKKPKPSPITTTKKPRPSSTTTRRPRPSSKPTQQSVQKLKTDMEEKTPSGSNSNQQGHHKVHLPEIIMLDDMQRPASQKKPTMNEDIPETTEHRIPGIPVDNHEDPFSEPNDNQWQVVPNRKPEHVERVPVDYTTLRPYVPPAPPKKSDHQWFSKRPGNDTTSSTRPNEFYDDEIFGYDPYQTFFHGVYVPVVEVGTLSELQRQPEEEEDTSDDEEFYSQKPQKRPSSSRPQSSSSSKHGGRPAAGNKRKPVPTLPDHLHRPRPSHLQYQHGAADDTDPETGLLNAHYEHPGHSFSPDGESVTPDKLSLVPRPPLPTQVRKNFTDHHDHHVQHQHGLGGHGHDHGHGGHHGSSHHDHLHHHLNEQAATEKRPTFSPAPNGNPGLEATLTSLDEEKRLFVDINNRLALRLLSALSNPVSHSTNNYGSMVISPFTITSSLGMIFLGSRGQTAAQLDGFLQMDDMLTFNPHMMYHNVTEAFLSQPNTAAAIIRLLVTDKERGDVLEFYKTRVQHFYEARVEEVDYKFAGHLAQSIINQMIRAQIQRHSYEMLNYSLPLMGPMSLITAAFFDGQFAGARDTSVDNMNFIHLAALNQAPSARRLFQVPAFALRGHFRAAFDKDLDATAVELPYTSRDLSLILVMPGKPGEFAFGGVTSLKSRLNLEAWTKLMRGFYPRDSFKVVVPRFRHQTSVNLSHTMNRFGLTDMFEPTLAKFKGVNGLTDLYLDKNMMHFAEFGTWEKLSDTLTESNNRNLDLIRILRPHVREHYGNHGEPMSVKEWLVKSRNNNDEGQQRSADDEHTMMPDDVSRLRFELERLKRRHHVHSPAAPTQDRSWYNPHSNPLESYSKVRGTTVEFKPRRLKAGIRTERSRVYYFRQDEPSVPTEQETVLRFERPFLYVLRHNPTGMILMTGQYTEPLTDVQQ